MSLIDSGSKLLICSVNRVELAQYRLASVPVTMVSVKRINSQCGEEN
jgi:hypothetical protein